MSKFRRFLDIARANCPALFDDIEPTAPKTTHAPLSDLPPIPLPEPVPVAAPAPPLSFLRHMDVTESLTECLDKAECPVTARKIFKILHTLALITTYARGIGSRPSVAIFHLPVELIAAHLQISRVTIWRNIRPLITAGILDARDHKAEYCGEMRVTGKVWAVSVLPERILQKEQRPARVSADDLRHKWRDLTADIRQGRTAYAITRTEEQQDADRARREAEPEVKKRKRHERAKRRKEKRARALAKGENVATGRAAATQNAAETRAKNNVQPVKNRNLQQSIRGPMRAIDEKILIEWALTPFLQDNDNHVSMTVAQAFFNGLDVVFSLRSLTEISKRDRTEAVEKVAGQLATQFDDHDNLTFWTWLLWQLIRGHAQGQDYFDDVSHILSRVLHDVQHDETMNARTLKRPASIVVKELKKCGVWDALKELRRYRVGRAPPKN